jgi:hypothetical protein
MAQMTFPYLQGFTRYNMPNIERILLGNPLDYSLCECFEYHTQIQTKVKEYNNSHMKQIFNSLRFRICQIFCQSHFSVSLKTENFVRFFCITVYTAGKIFDYDRFKKTGTVSQVI